MTDFRIVVQVDTSAAEAGVRKIDDRLGRLDQTARGVGRALTSALAVAGIGVGVTQVIRLADAYTTLRNRTRIAVGETGDLEGTLDNLFVIAQRVQGPIDGLVTLYQRGSIASRELGASQEDMLRFVEAVGYGLGIQGGAAAAANGALLQLSQALGAGVVRAEEFNSILEGAFPIAQAAARGIDEAGGSVSRLRQLIVAGQITSQEFFDGLLSQAPELERVFATTQITIDGAFTVLRNALIQTFGEFNTASGLTAGLARVVVLLAQNLDTVVRVAIAAGIALGVHFAVRGVGAAVAGLVTLGRAIVANPLGALLTALTVGISLFVTFAEKMQLTSGSAATAFDAIAVVASDAMAILGDGLAWVGSLFTGFQDQVDGFDLLVFVKSVARGLDQVAAFFRGMYEGIRQLFRTFPQVIGDLVIDGLNRALRGAGSFVNGIISMLNRIPGVSIDAIQAPQIANAFEGAGAAVGTAFQTGFQAGLNDRVFENYVDNVANRAEERARARAAQAARDGGNAPPGPPTAPGGPGGDAERRLTLAQVLQDLGDEAKLLGLTARAREIASQMLDIENKLREDGVRLNAGERETLRVALLRNQALADQATLMDELRQPAEDLLVREQSLLGLYEQGAISAGTYRRELEAVRLAMIELRIQQGDGSFMDGFVVGLYRWSEAARNVASEIGSTFQEMFTGMADGFADSVGRAIVYSEDLGSAILEIARSAVSELISALVKLGIQWLVQKALGDTLAASGAAASAALATTTAAAWAPAAAAVSLATMGANSGPALAGMASVNAASLAFATAGAVKGFAMGGLVKGPGSSTSDSIPAWLSDEEFVVNANATKRNRGLLEAINSGYNPPTSPRGQGGGTTVHNEVHLHIEKGEATTADDMMDTVQRRLGPWIEQKTVAALDREQRPGGRLSRGRNEIVG